MNVQWRYTLSEPMLGDAERDAVTACLDSGWLSMGPQTKLFEDRFSDLIDARQAIAVSNGTAALHLALAALGVGDSPNDEVIQPSINFVAAANMTKALGAVPVFADIVSETEPTLDPAAVAEHLTERTKAVVVMHYGGYPARTAEIVRLCQARGVPVVEDACHAPAQEDPETGRHLGTIGAIGCFSFFSNKNMTTAEGGMVATDDPALADRMRMLRSHGMTTLSWDRHHGRPSTYDVVAHGFNYRIDDLRSSLGLAQLVRLREINTRRRRLAAVYAHEIRQKLGNRAHFLFGDRSESGTAHLAGVLVDPAVRDRVRAQMADLGVQTSLHYPPIHRFTAFTGHTADLPISERFSRSMITLPMHGALTEDGVGAIVQSLADAFDRHG
ncbi:MAG: DegT/DnrJ/EryC1/StrS family aminotransferase [Pseudomonadota bacterium]